MIDSVKASHSERDEGSTIRVVSSRTGLPMETLRAWERRHGFPKPERRQGSNRRLYSAIDIERLVAIKSAIDRGYRVGDVISKSVSDLERLVDIAGDKVPRATAASEASPSPIDVDGLVDLLAVDRIGDIERAIRQGASLLGPADFVTQLAHPFAVRVGEAWAKGRLSIRHEHLATECLVTQMRLMLAGYQDIQSRPVVLLATLPGELHTLPLQMVALYLVSRGAKPRLLGGEAPTSEISHAASALRADAVGLTVSPTSDPKRIGAHVRALRKLLPAHVTLWLGGEGATALGVTGNNVRIVTSWEGIDDAIVACGQKGSTK